VQLKGTSIERKEEGRRKKEEEEEWKKEKNGKGTSNLEERIAQINS